MHASTCHPERSEESEVEQAREEIVHGSLKLLSTHALMKAQSPDYIRESQDEAVEVWDITQENAPYRLRTLPGHSIWVGAVAFGAHGLLASISYGGKVKLWEVEKGYSLETFQAQAGCLWSLSFSPGGRSIAVGGDDLAIKQWKVESVQGKESARFIRNFLWVHHDGLVSSFQS